MPRRQEISDNEYYVLNALTRDPRYGYAIRKDVEQITGGKKKLSLATLYDTLHRLLQDGFIERKGDKEVEGRIRRTYCITDMGKQALMDRYSTMELLRRIHHLQVAESEA